MDVDVPALWHATLRPTDAIKAAVVCNLDKEQFIVMAKGSWIEMRRPDANRGHIELTTCQNLFANIRSIVAIRLPSEKYDRLAVSTDSGCFVILKYEYEGKCWTQEVCEPYGRTGVRRSIPGEYLAADPRGRACMIGAFEKTKFVYVVNRDGDRASVNSPIVVNSPETFVYSMVGMDVGYANPQFCCIEQQHGGPRMLTTYELDLGLNHTAKRKSNPVDDSSHVLVSLPGGRDGPSGVLVGGLGQLEYFGLEDEYQAAILPNREYVVSAAVHRMRSSFFVLVQTADGSLFKVTYQKSLKVEYFDYIPRATTFAIFKAGFLYAASEIGDHGLYQFLGLDGAEEFTPGKSLENVSLVETVSSLSPILGSFGTKREFGLTTIGAGIRKLEAGLVPTFLVDAPLPSRPLHVFSVRTKSSSVNDEYILLSFQESTLVLGVSPDGDVQETSDHSFVTTSPTLNINQVGLDSVVQVHSHGVRQITSEKSVDWKPGSAKVVSSALNSCQVLVGLSDSRLIYFEIDEDGMLVEYQKPAKYDGRKLECLAIGPVPKGRVRSQFAAVGFDDSTLRILSLENPPLSTVAVQVLSSLPTSLYMEPGLLHIGLNNGVYVACRMNDGTGTIEEVCTRIAGSKPTKIASFLSVEDTNLRVMILSNRTWLSKSFGELLAINTDPLSSVSPFSSTQCPQGALAVVNESLRVFTLKTQAQPLRITTHSTPELITRVIKPTASNSELCIGLNGVHSEGRTLLSAPISAVCNIRFESSSEEFLAIAVNKEIRIYAYRSTAEGPELEFVHNTPLKSLCHALAPYKGYLLAGLGDQLVKFSLGRKQLLRQAAVSLQGAITFIRVSRDRNVWVCAGRHIVLLIDLIAVADDPVPRAITFLETLDHSTVICGDKFGSICVLRLPHDAEHLSTDSHGIKIIEVQRSRLNGCPFKMKVVAHFYVDDAITALYRTTLIPGGTEVVVYAGIQGTLGALVPFESLSEYKFLANMESNLREDLGTSPVGRDHLSFRGYYAPPRNVVDMDFCRKFQNISTTERADMAEKIGLTPTEIDQRLSEFWSRSLWS